MTLEVIFEAGQNHIRNFDEDYYEPNMRWFMEVQQVAMAIFKKRQSADFLLPRTPGGKRKFVDVERANALDNKESTFLPNVADNKKLKIDDLSNINDTSTVDLSNISELNNTSRSLRPRKARAIPQPVKRSRRIAQKKDDVKSIVISQDFIPPQNINNVKLQCSIQESNNLTIEATQIQQSGILAMTISPRKNGKLFKNIQVQLDFEDVVEDTTGVTMQEQGSSDTQEILSKDTLVEVSIDGIDPPISNDVLCTPGSIRDAVVPGASTQHVFASTPETTGIKSMESNLLDTSCIPVEGDLPVPAEVVKTADEEKEVVPDQPGRRDTYKVMVDSIIDGNDKKSQPKVHIVDCIVDGNDKKPPPKVDINKPNMADKDVKKFPKVTKPVKPGGNVVSNIKSFLKRPGSPRTEAGQIKTGGIVVTNVKSLVKQPSPKSGLVAKKAAELEKKELLRQNTIKEGLKKKQQQIDEKKKLREEREKYLAEQQQKRIEENEIKRKRLETKEAQIAKNQDEIRKARELEEKQRKELREAKKAELDARRQRDEEEHRIKAEEILRDEKRKQEVLQRKYELDEQKRMKKKAEKGMMEKDKLRLVEETRMNDEERKKKVYEEKEKHRLEVARKKEEQKEKEILERQLREEKNKEAEKEINDAKKQKAKEEEEKRRAKERIREEIREKLKHEYNTTKTVVDVTTMLRSSPRLELPKIKYNAPVVPLVQRDSMYIDYGIDDLNSDDSTDDESQPTKRIPSWAQGARLKKQLTRQFYTNIDPDDIFINCMEPLRLEQIFEKNKKKYFTRSSSAHWNSPPIKGLGYNYH